MSDSSKPTSSSNPASASNQTWTIAAEEAGVRLDKWLADSSRLGSRSKARSALERGKVLLNEQDLNVRDAPRLLREGEIIRIWQDRPGSSRKQWVADRSVAGLHILREDDDLMVVNKPAGLLTVRRSPESREPTLLSKVERYLDSGAKKRAYVVHRIDRLTTGTVVVAKHRKAQQLLKEQFYRREPKRCYWAVVYGNVKQDSGTWRSKLAADSSARRKREAKGDERSEDAISHFRVLERFSRATLLEVHLETGKRNQIRIQGSLHGHPLVGERIYREEDDFPVEIPFPRQALHALSIAFQHPRGHESWEIKAPLPGDFEGLLVKLRRETQDITSKAKDE